MERRQLFLTLSNGTLYTSFSLHTNILIGALTTAVRSFDTQRYNLKTKKYAIDWSIGSGPW